MLVLSRKKNESINIGDDISIVVAEIRGDKVRLGCDAPISVPVHRSEVFREIAKEQRQEGLSVDQKIKLARDLESIVTNAIHSLGYRTATASMCIEHCCKTISSRVSISS